jgi:DNA repair exonuclease SbcCD ATPase subunit
MKRIFVSIVAMLFISVLFMACADEKGPAELAMKAAEQAVAATKAEAEKLVPDQVAALESVLASAKDKLAKGEFKEALSEAQGLVGKAKDVLAAAQAKKDELTQKWTELSQGLPQMVEAIQGKVDDLSKLKKLPKAITAEKLAEAKSGLEAVKADLAKAQESFTSGNIEEAIAVATAVKEKAVKAMESLGITAPEPAKS